LRNEGAKRVNGYEPDEVVGKANSLNSNLVTPVEFDRFVEKVSNAGFYWAILDRAPV